MDLSGSAAKNSERAGRRAMLDWLWLAAPLFYPAVYFGSSSLPDAIRALLSFLLVIVIPGWLFQLVLLPRARIGHAARVTRAYALGVAAVSVLGLVAWFLGDDVTLGPVSAFNQPPAPQLSRISALVWGEAILVLILAVIHGIRSGHRSRRRSRDEAKAAIAEKPSTGRESATGAPRAGSSGSAEPERLLAAAESEEGDETESGPRELLTPMQRIVREAYRLGDQYKQGHPVAPRWATLLVLGVIVLTAGALGFYAGGDFGYGRDSLAHTAVIREMIEQDRVLPRTSFYADGDGAAVDSRMGFFHVALAAVCRLGHLDAPRLWRFLPGILAPFGLIIFHTLARRLLVSEGTALFATFLAFLLFGEVDEGLITRFAYGNQMGMVLSWATLAFGLHFAFDARRRSLLALVALASFGATATHVFSILQILFSFAVFLIALAAVHGFRHRTTVRIAGVLAAAAVGAVPVVIWRYAFAYAPLNPLHTQRQGLLLLTERLYIVLPSQWTPDLMGVGFGAILLSLFLWRRARRDDHVLYLAALSIAPLLVVANPLVVPLLEPLLGYLVGRFIVATPFILVLAYVARWMSESFLQLTSAARIVKSILVYAFMIGLLFPRLEAFARSYSPDRLAEERKRSAFIWSDLLADLDARIRRPAVVLSDPYTGYSIPALTPHYTVAVLHQHASPSDSLGLQRLAACRDVLSPYVGTSEKARMCRRFNVDYVFVNGQIGHPLRGYFATAGPQVAPEQLAALTADEALFQRIWEFGDLQSGLFRVRRENLDALCGIVRPGATPPAGRRAEDLAAPLVLRRLPFGTAPALADTIDGVTLVGAKFDTTLIARSEGTYMTLYWRRVGPPSDLPLVNYLRLETEPPRGPLWMSRISKVHRRLVHSRGEIYRLQVTRYPFESMFPPEYWPRDCYVADRVYLRLPDIAAPGEYAVQLKWMQQTFLPILPLSHFLSDRDAYAGQVVGALEVY